MNILPASAESVGVRPEHLAVVEPSNNVLRGNIALSEYSGAVTLMHVELPNGQTCLVVHDGKDLPAFGSEIGLNSRSPKPSLFRSKPGDGPAVDAPLSGLTKSLAKSHTI
jgi:ABC-type sugar transport system ATPase subunit